MRLFENDDRGSNEVLELPDDPVSESQARSYTVMDSEFDRRGAFEFLESLGTACGGAIVRVDGYPLGCAS